MPGAWSLESDLGLVERGSGLKADNGGLSEVTGSEGHQQYPRSREVLSLPVSVLRVQSGGQRSSVQPMTSATRWPFISWK